MHPNIISPGQATRGTSISTGATRNARRFRTRESAPLSTGEDQQGASVHRHLGRTSRTEPFTLELDVAATRKESPGPCEMHRARSHLNCKAAQRHPFPRHMPPIRLLRCHPHRKRPSRSQQAFSHGEELVANVPTETIVLKEKRRASQRHGWLRGMRLTGTSPCTRPPLL